MTIRIEHLKDWPQHVEQIANWQQLEFGYLSPTVTLEQRGQRLRDSLQTNALPSALVALAEGGRAVGAASVLSKTITHSHLTPWLSTVVVLPEFRGKGIASSLSLKAASEAKRLGFESIYLFTPRNESLYQRLGWAVVERSVLNGQTVAIMRRPTDL